MSNQNINTHRRYIPIWHWVTGGLIIIILGGSIFILANSDKHTHYSAVWQVIASIVMASIFWYCRVFALRAQDRAIRAEENFRYFILTGKPLDNRLRMSQIIALRFASDEEFVELAKRAVNEKMSSYDIKTAIKNWKADYNRV
jgi:cbb3-type cytochrome oxidase subunit 3